MFPRKISSTVLVSSPNKQLILDHIGSYESSLKLLYHLYHRKLAIPRISHMGVSENSAPLNPMVLLIIIPIKWLFHLEYTLFSNKPISCWTESSNSHRLWTLELRAAEKCFSAVGKLRSPCNWAMKKRWEHCGIIMLGYIMLQGSWSHPN